MFHRMWNWLVTRHMKVSPTKLLSPGMLTNQQPKSLRTD